MSAVTDNYLKLMTCKSHKINIYKVLVYMNFFKQYTVTLVY